MFNDPSHLGHSQDTLDKFKEQLASKVDQHYQKSIADLTKADKLEAEHSSWSANYQVFGLEHYFAQPDLAQELDMWLRGDWERDLEFMRYWASHEKKRAEQKATASTAEVSGCAP
jgi:hypothetical protein